MNTQITKTTNGLIKKMLLTAIALLAIISAALGLGMTDVQAGGWKKFKKYHHYNAGYHYNYKYYRGCKRDYYGKCIYKRGYGYKRHFKKRFKRKFRR